MRPKFVLSLAAVTALILTAFCLLHRKPVNVQPAMHGDVALQPTERHPQASPPPAAFAAAPVPPPSPEERKVAIDQEIQQVQVWSQADDATGAEKIMMEITTNSERQVRMAAIKAAKQTGDRGIIPELQDAAARAEDAEEKRALLDAADFLAGPTVSEQLTNPQPQPEIVLTP